MSSNSESVEEILGYQSAILDTVADGIVCIDTTGVITTFNKAAEAIFGYGADEVVGQKINMLMPMSHARHHDSYLANYASSGKAKLIGTRPEVEGKRKSGEIFPIEVGLTEASYQGRKIFVGVVRDITERKRVERLKSEFIAAVNHELRTPLTSIAGPLALIQSGKLGPLSPVAQKSAEIAMRNCNRLTVLINDLLDFEQTSSGKAQFDLQSYEVHELVSRAVQDNAAEAQGRGVILSVLQETVYDCIRVDRARLLQVIGNLLSNALKFSEAGSEVWVGAECFEGRIRISVADRGIGIAREHHDRIFQRFTQVDSSATRRAGGTGLGLAISKQLTEQMGGEIGFESELERGSTFWVTFPVAPSVMAAAAE